LASILVRDSRVAEFVGDAIGVVFSPPLTCIGLERDGRIVAGVVLNVYEGSDIHVSIAGSDWTRGLIVEVGHYVYSVLGCERMTVLTEEPKIVRLAERLGGSVEGLLRNHFGPGRDAFLVGVLKADFRF